MELDLDEPKSGEVQIRFVASGLCHSDLHIADGDLTARWPIVGGHEGAGVVESVGPGVTRLAPGDHVVCSFVPSCGSCRYCSTGRQNLCDLGANAMIGCLPDGTFRRHADGVDYGGVCMLGTFAERATVSQFSVVKIDDWIPLNAAVLVGCGVPTGWGAAVYTGGVRAGDIVIVYGIGGIGIHAVQGAARAGAAHVVVVDPIQFKRDTALRLGATHAFATAEEAHNKIVELSWGQGADQALVSVGVMTDQAVADAVAAVGKGGTVVLIGLAAADAATIRLPGNELTLQEKTIRGSLFGSANPQHDIVRLLRLYDNGGLVLDELVTRTYSLDEINLGYQDLREGKNIRGVLTFDA
jgi:S-(hydroxymethyl)glutathione dehydrogenase/alcohol dehydrogenase